MAERMPFVRCAQMGTVRTERERVSDKEEIERMIKKRLREYERGIN